MLVPPKVTLIIAQRDVDNLHMDLAQRAIKDRRFLLVCWCNCFEVFIWEEERERERHTRNIILKCSHSHWEVSQLQNTVQILV